LSQIKVIFHFIKILFIPISRISLSFFILIPAIIVITTSSFITNKQSHHVIFLFWFHFVSNSLQICSSIIIFKYLDIILIENNISGSLDYSTFRADHCAFCLFLTKCWQITFWTKLFITNCIFIFNLVWVYLLIMKMNCVLSELLLLSTADSLSILSFLLYLSLCRFRLVIWLNLRILIYHFLRWRLLVYLLRIVFRKLL